MNSRAQRERETSSTMEDKALEFQKTLMQVQESLNKTELQELVFLCTDILQKDLSSVVTARELFTQLQKRDLLSFNNPSLLIELLMIIKRNKLLRDLQLKPQFSSSQVSPYRRMLFELAENITDEELKNIKFLLLETLKQNKLQQIVTLPQLFLEMEKKDLIGPNNLGFIESNIVPVYPKLKKIISDYRRENVGAGVPEEQQCRDKLQDLSITTIPVPPEDPTCGKSSQELLPPAYFSQNKHVEMHTSVTTFTSRTIEGPAHYLNLSGQGDKNPIFSEPNANTLKLEQYDMSGDWRGVALIINNYDFSNCRDLKDRHGSEVDEQSLVEVFQWLGFETVVMENCSSSNMKAALDVLCKRDHTQANCVVCCILSHGYDGGLFGVDGERVSLTDLLDKLDGNNCKSLLYKPKLFFIQACRGTQEQKPASLLESDDSNNNSNMGFDLFTDAQVPRESIAERADYLVAMATVPGFVSFREKSKGTWFIQSLCEHLTKLVPCGIDLLAILTEVNKEVSKKADTTGTRKQMPQPEFTLTKRLVFPVPKNPMPSK